MIAFGAVERVGTGRVIGAVYNRYEYEAEKRDALTKWDGKLALIVA